MNDSAILTFSDYFSTAVREVIFAASGLKITASETVLKVPNVKISGDVGSFVSFKGDYDGILIMNFTGAAAVEIVSSYLRNMGFPENEIPENHTSDEVRNNIGETVNQIIGKFRIFVETNHKLVAKANIPAVIPITIPIGLLLESANPEKQECVRLSFSTPMLNRFHVEVSMEPIELLTSPAHARG